MTEERSGGLAAWAPRAVPGPGVDLTPAQELAIAFRHLDDVGWCENMTGHITVQQGDDRQDDEDKDQNSHVAVVPPSRAA